MPLRAEHPELPSTRIVTLGELATGFAFDVADPHRPCARRHPGGCSGKLIGWSDRRKLKIENSAVCGASPDLDESPFSIFYRPITSWPTSETAADCYHGFRRQRGPRRPAPGCRRADAHKVVVLKALDRFQGQRASTSSTRATTAVTSTLAPGRSKLSTSSPSGVMRTVRPAPVPKGWGSDVITPGSSAVSGPTTRTVQPACLRAGTPDPQGPGWTPRSPIRDRRCSQRV